MHTKIRRHSAHHFRAIFDENYIISYYPFTSTDDKTTDDVWGNNADAIGGRQDCHPQQAMPKLSMSHAPASLK